MSPPRKQGTDDFSRYEAMRQAGSGPDDVYQAAIQDGVDTITRIRLIRFVFSLGLLEAKEVMVRGAGWANSLQEYQDRMANELQE